MIKWIWKYFKSQG